MNTVNFELINAIRRKVSRTEKQVQIIKNRKKWMRLMSALDVLEDTSWAIEYYVEREYPEDIKGRYLYTYGLLQALFVQQDAVNSIHCALFDKEIDFIIDFPTVNRIREMRNDVTGHPTCRKNKEFIHLAQCSMKKDGFYYIKTQQGEKNEIIDVDVSEAIEEVANCVNSLLSHTIGQLDEEFVKYIDQHKDRKMKEIFNLLGYAKEKVLLETHMNEWGYSKVKDMVKKCEEELVLRYGSADAIDSYKYLLDEIKELFSLIDGGVPQISSELRGGMKKYLLQTLFIKLTELERYCEETDTYFSNYGKETDKTTATTSCVIFLNAEEISE